MNSLVSSDPVLHQRLTALEDRRLQVLGDTLDKLVISIDEVPNVALRAWRDSGHGRVIVGIGGFPASGKTSLAKKMTASINSGHGGILAAHLPMDGFHFRNSVLNAEGNQDIKGDLVTYDLRRFVEKLAEFQGEPFASMTAPDYIRLEHEVCDDVIAIGEEVRILIVEGIYVGYSEGVWDQARMLFDPLIYLDVVPAVCAKRIVSRNLEAGRDRQLIRRKLGNDFGFMERGLTILPNADYVVRP